MNQDIKDPRTIGVEGLRGVNETNEVPVLSVRQLMLARNQANRETAPIEYLGNELEGRGLGSSTYDSAASSMQQIEEIENIRGEEQPWYSQLVNGVLKGAVTAGTTFLDGTVGLLYGLGSGIVNAVNAEDGKGLQAFGETLFNNEISKALRSVTSAMEEILPNYRTQDEIENPYALRNIFSMNTIADDFLKNLGFTVGAFYSGNAFLGALRATKLAGMMSSTAAKTIGSVVSGLNEGRIEAGHTYDDMVKAEEENLKNQYKSLLDQIEAEPDITIIDPESGESISSKQLKLQQLGNNFRNAEANIRDRAAKAGIADLIMNTLYLPLNDAYMFGKLYARGFKPKADLAGRVGKKGIDRAAAQEAIQESLGKRIKKEGKKFITNPVTRKKAALKGLGIGVTEGIEEGNQAFFSAFSANEFAPDSPDAYYEALTNSDYQMESKDTMTALADGWKDSWGGSDVWKEVGIGFLTGIIGMPTFGKVNNSDHNTYLGRGKTIGLSGGLFGEMSNSSYLNKEAEKAVNDMNKFVKKVDDEDNFFIRSKAFTDDMDGWLEAEDKFEYTNSSDNDLFNAVDIFGRTGRLDYLRDLVSEDFDNMSDEDILKLAEDTSDENNDWLNVDGTTMSPDEIRKKLNEKKKDILNSIDLYENSLEEVKAIGNGVLDDDQTRELAWLKFKVNKFKDRFGSIKEDNNKEISDLKNAVGAFLNGRGRGMIDEDSEEGKIIINNMEVLDNFLDLLKTAESPIQVASLMKQADKTKLLDFFENMGFDIIEDMSGLDGQSFKNLMGNLRDTIRIADSAKSFNDRLKEFVNDPTELKKNRNRIDNKVKENEVEKTKSALQERFDWNAPTSTIADTIEANMAEIEKMGGFKAFYNSLDDTQKSKVKEAQRLRKSIDGLKTLVEDSDLSDMQKGILSQLVDENSINLNNINDLLSALNDAVEGGEVRNRVEEALGRAEGIGDAGLEEAIENTETKINQFLTENHSTLINALNEADKAANTDEEIDSTNIGRALNDIEEKNPANKPAPKEPTQPKDEVPREKPIKEPKSYLTDIDLKDWPKVKKWLDAHPNATVSALQREFTFGYNKASRMMDEYKRVTNVAPDTQPPKNQPKKVVKPSIHRSSKNFFGENTSSWKYYTTDSSNVDEHTGNITAASLTNSLKPVIDYAIEAGLLGNEYKLSTKEGDDRTAVSNKENSDKAIKATNELYKLGIRNPKQLIEYVEQHEGEEVGQPSENENIAPENVSDFIQINNTNMGFSRIFPLNDWNKKDQDIRLEPDGWGTKNGLTYYKKSFKGGRAGDNVTIWLKNEPSSEIKHQLELFIEKGERLDDTNTLSRILNGEQVYEPTKITPTDGVPLDIGGETDIHTIDTESANDKVDSDISRGNSDPKYHQRPQLTQYYMHGYDLISYLDYLKSHKDSYPVGVDKKAFDRYIEKTHEYLEREGAFNYIEGTDKNNRLREGQEIIFTVDEQLNKDAGTFIVVMKTKEGQVIGTLPSELELGSRTNWPVYNNSGEIIGRKPDDKTLAEKRPEVAELVKEVKKRYEEWKKSELVSVNAPAGETTTIEVSMDGEHYRKVHLVRMQRSDLKIGDIIWYDNPEGYPDLQMEITKITPDYIAGDRYGRPTILPEGRKVYREIGEAELEAQAANSTLQQQPFVGATSKVSQLMGGTMPLSTHNKSVAAISRDEVPIIGIVDENGNISRFRGTKMNDPLNPHTPENAIRGQVYFMIPTNKGTYLPALCSGKKLKELSDNDWYIQQIVSLIKTLPSTQADKSANEMKLYRLLNIKNPDVERGSMLSVTYKDDKIYFNIPNPKDPEHPLRPSVTVVDGQISDNDAISAIRSIIRAYPETTISVDINRLGNSDADVEYRKNIASYLITNIVEGRPHSINDWFLYEPTDIEKRVINKERLDKADTEEVIKKKGASPKGIIKATNPADLVNVVRLEESASLKAALLGGDESKDTMREMGIALTVLSEDKNEGTSISSNRKSALSSLRRRRGKPLATDVTEDSPATLGEVSSDIQTIKRMFPTLGDTERVILVKGLIDTVNEKGDPIKAYGLFKDGILYISDQSPKGTAFHEAFHYISDMLLSEKEKKNMFEAAAQKYGNLPEIELEEKLAEDFRDFMNGYDALGNSSIRNFFRKLKHFVKSLVGRTTYLDNLFFDIYTNKYKNRKEFGIGSSMTKFLEVNRVEMDKIKARATADGTFMKAPNGKPTNLTERQWLQVRTKAFKDWFGDWINDPANASKVVDENGEPKVMLRTDDAGKAIMGRGDGGAFFATDNLLVAGSYASDEADLYKGFVNLKNPYVVKGESHGFFFEYKGRETTVQEAQPSLIQEGYDGVYFERTWDVGDYADVEPEDDYWANNVAMFNPNQFKSATDNIGTFDNNNPSITEDDFADRLLEYKDRKLAYDNLDEETKGYLRMKKVTQEDYDSLSTEAKETTLQCMI